METKDLDKLERELRPFVHAIYTGDLDYVIAHTSDDMVALLREAHTGGDNFEPRKHRVANVDEAKRSEVEDVIFLFSYECENMEMSEGRLRLAAQYIGFENIGVSEAVITYLIFPQLGEEHGKAKEAREAKTRSKMRANTITTKESEEEGADF